MATYRNRSKCTYIETKIDDTEAMITWQSHKHTNKQQQKQTPETGYTLSKHIFIILIHGYEKSLMKFAAVSAETLKTLKCLPKILFKLEIMDLCLLPRFCILFKIKWKVLQWFMSEIVPAILKL